MIKTKIRHYRECNYGAMNIYRVRVLEDLDGRVISRKILRIEKKKKPKEQNS